MVKCLSVCGLASIDSRTLFSDIEGVINTPKLGEHTNIEVIIDVVLRVVVLLNSIGQ
jgi:hypothetical protein